MYKDVIPGTKVTNLPEIIVTKVSPPGHFNHPLWRARLKHYHKFRITDAHCCSHFLLSYPSRRWKINLLSIIPLLAHTMPAFLSFHPSPYLRVCYTRIFRNSSLDYDADTPGTILQNYFSWLRSRRRGWNIPRAVEKFLKHAVEIRDWWWAGAVLVFYINSRFVSLAF